VAIQNERDLACRKVQEAHNDNEACGEENRDLMIGIADFKRQMRGKDCRCLKTHLRAGF
jgi:hypothetical protein